MDRVAGACSQFVHLEHSREHATHEGSAGHGEPEGDGRHDKHDGHSVAMFRNKFWV
jgi:hypothetical protein